MKYLLALGYALACLALFALGYMATELYERRGSLWRRRRRHGDRISEATLRRLRRGDLDEQ